jgi:hypothetical protein
MVQALSFGEEPDYDQIRSILQLILEKQEQEYDYFYDWDEIELAKNQFANQTL